MRLASVAHDARCTKQSGNCLYRISKLRLSTLTGGVKASKKSDGRLVRVGSVAFVCRPKKSGGECRQSLLLRTNDWSVADHEVAWRRDAIVRLCIRRCCCSLRVDGIYVCLLIAFRHHHCMVIAADIAR